MKKSPCVSLLFVSAALHAAPPTPLVMVSGGIKLLMGADGGFITGSDFLMDGGATASYWYGELAAI
jgi:hypothetical protein